MQFDLRLRAPGKSAPQRAEEYLDAAVQGIFVHLVKGAIHQPRQISLDEDVLANQKAHQAADGAVFAERDERTEVAVDERLELLAREPAAQLLDEMRGLLMSRLSPRRHRRRVPFAWTCRAVADGENVGIGARLQRRRDDQLVAAVDIEPVEVAEELRPLDAGGPHHELGGDELAARQAHAFGPHLAHLRARTDFRYRDRRASGASPPKYAQARPAGGGRPRRSE